MKREDAQIQVKFVIQEEQGYTSMSLTATGWEKLKIQGALPVAMEF